MDDLITKAQRGDRLAVADLARDHYAKVYRFCVRRVGDESAKDATQDTFVTMQKSIRKYEARSTFETWLFGIANNACRNLARKMRIEPLRIENWMEAQTDGGHGQVEAKTDLASALAKLSPEHREVVMMHEIEEMTYAQIAEILGVPEGTVKSRLHHAFVALRRSFVGVTA